MTITQKIGIILANLGTPDAPQPSAISRYLAAFLMDPRVVDLPRWKWYPLLKAIILPMRSKRIAQNYQSIWTEQGSPLLAITKQQQAGLQAYLNEKGINAQIEIAMTYGNPSMQSAVKNLLKNDVERMIVLPLYPQSQWWFVYSADDNNHPYSHNAAECRDKRKAKTHLVLTAL